MKLLTMAFAGALSTFAASEASAIIIDPLGEVGGLDTIVAVTTDVTKDADGNDCGNGSNPGVEECWAESILSAMNVDLIFEGDKGEKVPVYFGTGSFSEYAAFSLIDSPQYYIIKNTNEGWALMQNNGLLAFGVIDSADPILDGLKDNFLTTKTADVSHVTEFNGGGEVPEPATLALLGAGIVGFGFGRRRLGASRH